jgi:DNA-binding IclR family transcriptional regulator
MNTDLPSRPPLADQPLDAMQRLPMHSEWESAGQDETGTSEASQHNGGQVTERGSGAGNLEEASGGYQCLEARGRGVLDGAFRLLRALPRADRHHQLSDLARLTGIPRSSVYRLMAQLHAAGAVERPRGQYVVAQSLSDFARNAEPVAGLREHSWGVMQALRSRTGATVSLVIPTDSGCSALEVILGRETLPTPIHAGIVMPSTAAAALVLDPSPAPERAESINGWATDDGCVYLGLTCYAAAIRVAGRVEAVLQISTTADHPSSQFAALTRQSADRIAAQLSAHP